jgi:tetratricopeptide (TPR) repeat protein
MVVVAMSGPRPPAIPRIPTDLVAALMLAAITAAVFAATLGHGWVDLDDHEHFLANPHYRGLGPAQLRWMLTGVIMGHWTPVTWLSHGLDYVLWGMNPAGYHLGNVLLHAANAALFFALARRLLAVARPGAGATPVRLGALAAALFFALHPLRVESVAWITERRDVLAGLFYLLTVLAWLRATLTEGRPQRGWYLGSLALFAIGLLSKSMLVSLPLVLLVLDVYPLRRLDPRAWRTAAARRVLVEKAPYLLLAVAAIAITSLTMRASLRVTPLELYPPLARVAMAAYSLVFYPWKTVAPLDLRPMYELPTRVSPFEPPFLPAVLAVAVITLALVAVRRRWPAGLAVWLAYAITLAPVSGLIHAGPQLVADRFGYLPSLGPCLLLGAGVAWAIERPALTRVVTAVVTAWIVWLAAMTWWQVQIWRDTNTLFGYTLSVDPDCAWCHALYGSALGNRGELAAAIPHLQRAAELKPRSFSTQANAGLAYLRAGRAPDALPYLERAVAMQPDSFNAATNLGLALVAVDRARDAIPHLERAHAARPDAPEPRLGLARAYTMLGRPEDAAAHHRALERLEAARAARPAP